MVVAVCQTQNSVLTCSPGEELDFTCWGDADFFEKQVGTPSEPLHGEVSSCPPV